MRCAAVLEAVDAPATDPEVIREVEREELPLVLFKLSVFSD